MEIFWLKIANRELQNAYNWYESNQQGLGTKFLLEVGKCIERINRTIIDYRRYFESQDIRYLLVIKFPFSIFFIKEETIKTVIVALLHKRQNIREIMLQRI